MFTREDREYIPQCSRALAVTKLQRSDETKRNGVTWTRPQDGAGFCCVGKFEVKLLLFLQAGSLPICDAICWPGWMLSELVETDLFSSRSGI